MRRSNKINKTEVEKEVARRKYGERQIDKWVKWSFTMRGKVSVSYTHLTLPTNREV